MVKTSFSFFATSVFLQWGFGVYKDEYFNQANQFIYYIPKKEVSHGGGECSKHLMASTTTREHKTQVGMDVLVSHSIKDWEGAHTTGKTKKGLF